MPKITKADLIVFLFFSKTIKPRPAFIKSPDRSPPNERCPLMNNSEITTDEAQLGITPIMVENNGVRYLFELMKLENVSSPINPIKKPKNKLTAKT